MPQHFPARRCGFTLIELSIVLVIIGLLVGGVLVGRDMIHAAMQEFLKPLAKHIEYLQKATMWIGLNGLANPDDAAGGAVEYQKMFALVMLAYVWARQAAVALEKLQAGGDKDFYEAKLATARFYMQKILPQTISLLASITAGSKSLMQASL